MKKRWLGLFAALLLAGSTAQAKELVINSDTSDPAPKKAWSEIVEEFKKANPDIDVKFNVYDHESYKTSIRNWLASQPPDVVFWYAGVRMQLFVERNLLEPISDVWDENKLHDAMSSSRSAITFNEKQYAVPYSYYQWGIYYRKDIFEKNGVAVPKTWDEFLAVCKKLKDAGVTPIAIGTKAEWTTGGWFDYLNLRVNGLPFHLDLMHGKVSYKDPKVKAVFEKWKQLVEPGYYIANHTSYNWQEAQAFMYQGKAAMYLIGNFIVPNFPPEVAGNMDFFQFPVIDPNVPMYEDAPTDIVAIPAAAKNKEDARKFLKFVAQPQVIRKLNDALGQLPTHKESGSSEDRFLSAGYKILSDAKGLAQFYDRDTREEMAKVGMKGFQEFMVKPDRLDAILDRIDKAREKIFKEKEQ